MGLISGGRGLFDFFFPPFNIAQSAVLWCHLENETLCMLPVTGWVIDNVQIHYFIF